MHMWEHYILVEDIAVVDILAVDILAVDIAAVGITAVDIAAVDILAVDIVVAADMPNLLDMYNVLLSILVFLLHELQFIIK